MANTISIHILESSCIEKFLSLYTHSQLNVNGTNIKKLYMFFRVYANNLPEYYQFVS